MLARQIMCRINLRRVRSRLEGRLQDHKGYAICCTPRSGSNYLCQLLSSSERLGNPLEYFNGKARRILESSDYPIDHAKQIEIIVTRGATDNKVFATKLFFSQHQDVTRFFDWTVELPNLKYILLQRHDTLAQAVSWVKAEQSSQYRSTMMRLGEVVYDYEKIAEKLNSIRTQTLGWEQFFLNRQIVPLRLFYEDIIENGPAAAQNVADILGLKTNVEVDMSKIDLMPQRDEINDTWRAQFLHDAPL